MYVDRLSTNDIRFGHSYLIFQRRGTRAVTVVGPHLNGMDRDGASLNGACCISAVLQRINQTLLSAKVSEQVIILKFKCSFCKFRAQLLDYVLRSDKSNIYKVTVQNVYTWMITVTI